MRIKLFFIRKYRVMLLLGMGMFLCTELQAQQGTVPAEKRKFAASNWSLSAGLGQQWLMQGGSDGKMFVGKFNAGTWFNPRMGVKINLQAGKKKLEGIQSVRYFSIGADYQFNLLTIFGDYNESSPFLLNVSVGPAYNEIKYPKKHSDYTNTVSLNIGLQAGYDFSPRWGIYTEFMSYTMRKFYAGSGLFVGTDWTVGLRFRFNKHSYPNKQNRLQAEEIRRLNERVDELTAAYEQMKELTPRSKAPDIKIPEKEIASIDIYFDEFSSFIGEEQLEKINVIGEWMKTNPDFNVSIVVFSDNLTDKGTDEKLRSGRMQTIRNLLIDKYRIKANRIKTIRSEDIGYKNLTGCNAKIMFNKQDSETL